MLPTFIQRAIAKSYELPPWFAWLDAELPRTADEYRRMLRAGTNVLVPMSLALLGTWHIAREVPDPPLPLQWILWIGAFSVAALQLPMAFGVLHIARTAFAERRGFVTPMSWRLRRLLALLIVFATCCVAGTVGVIALVADFAGSLA